MGSPLLLQEGDDEDLPPLEEDVDEGSRMEVRTLSLPVQAHRVCPALYAAVACLGNLYGMELLLRLLVPQVPALS